MGADAPMLPIARGDAAPVWAPRGGLNEWTCTFHGIMDRSDTNVNRWPIGLNRPRPITLRPVPQRGTGGARGGWHSG